METRIALRYRWNQERPSNSRYWNRSPDHEKSALAAENDIPKTDKVETYIQQDNAHLKMYKTKQERHWLSYM